jgi:maltose O-acetyltransferase
VVTRDIPANVIAAGVPCRVMRPITEDDRLGLPLRPAGPASPETPPA